MELILEQMRLFLLKEDFVSTQIIAKKISIKFFDDPAQQDLKLKYYNLMIRLDRDTSYLKTCRHYQAIAEFPKSTSVTPKESDEDNKKKQSADEEKKKKTEEEAAAVATSTPAELTPEQNEELKQRLIYAVLYCVLAPYDNEQNDMMIHLANNKRMEEIPIYK